MKINNNYDNLTLSSYNNKQTSSLINLNIGDKFNAHVLNIGRDEVTIKLENGEVLTAKTLSIPQARIGEKFDFIIRENSKGQILLEMLTSITNDKNNNILKELLREAELPLTKENISLLKFLVEQNLHISKKILQSAAFFKHVSSSMSDEKVLFLLREQFAVDLNSVRLLDNSLNGTLNLKSILNDIIDQILQISNKGVLKDILQTVFKMDNEAELFIEKFIGKPQTIKQFNNNMYDEPQNRFFSKFFMQLESLRELNYYSNHISKLDETVNNIIKILQNSNYKNELLTNALDNFKDSLQFMLNTNNSKEYIQIPFIINGYSNNCELIILKDKQAEKNYKKQITILLFLSFLNLGDIQTLINKNEKNLELLFRAESDHVLNIISNNIQKLITDLNKKDYNISVKFKRIELPFNILSNPEMQCKPESSNRYSMDIRV